MLFLLFGEKQVSVNDVKLAFICENQENYFRFCVKIFLTIFVQSDKILIRVGFTAPNFAEIPQSLEFQGKIFEERRN